MISIFKNIQKAAEVKNVPSGTYPVRIERVLLATTKESKMPVAAIILRITKGNYKNCKIFYGQIITEGFQMHDVNEFLRSLDTGISICFETYTQYGHMLTEIEHIASSYKMKYSLEYGINSKGYNTYNITRIA